MMSKVLWCLMLGVPAILTVYSVIKQRGLFRVGLIAAAFFSGWFLMVLLASALTDEAQARAPEGTYVCGMLIASSMTFGWIYSGTYVIACTVLSFGGIGITKLFKRIYTYWKLRRAPTA